MSLTPTIDHDKPAKIMSIDFAKADSIRQHASGRLRDVWEDSRPVTPEGKLLTPKQIRARARRKAKSAKGRKGGQVMTTQEFEALYKPVEDWDLEELARGRPRNSEGNFSGRKPQWVTREVHERAMEQFQLAIKTDMATQGITALQWLEYALNNDERDERGKMVVPPAAKNQAAMFLLEHIVGKPRQHVTQDISVKLQGILGMAMVNPNDALADPAQGGQGMQLAHLPGTTIPIGASESVPGSVIDDDEDLDFRE